MPHLMDSEDVRIYMTSESSAATPATNAGADVAEFDALQVGTRPRRLCGLHNGA